MTDAPLTTLIASTALLFAVHRLASAWEQVTEMRVAASAEPKTSPLQQELLDMPEDLTALAMQEREVWAQEEVMRVIRERYELYRDWNKVRSAMGVGVRTDA